jgi:release factor glutamine methyltransferase
MSAPRNPLKTGSVPVAEDTPALKAWLTTTLAAAGFVAAEEEAEELLRASRNDALMLAALIPRRLAGEPLAWLVGQAPFAGLEVTVRPGVYVPRWQSTELALRAVARLPESGAAADVCTGSGAIALALRQGRPKARIVATDTDPRAVENARANGIEVYEGDLLSPLPGTLMGLLDVVVAVAPYVPTAVLDLLPHDTLTFEDVAHYDGGPNGTALLERIATDAPAYLRHGGHLILELGGDQAERLAPLLDRLGYGSLDGWSDGEGDVRGIEAVFG